MNSSYDRRIYSIIEQTLRVPLEKLSDQVRRGCLEEWDSLGHMMLIDALNREFEISIPPERALEMESLQDIKRIIAELLGPRLKLINAE